MVLNQGVLSHSLRRNGDGGGKRRRGARGKSDSDMVVYLFITHNVLRNVIAA